MQINLILCTVMGRLLTLIDKVSIRLLSGPLWHLLATRMNTDFSFEHARVMMFKHTLLPS
jgi:hypothetical protein